MMENAAVDPAVKKIRILTPNGSRDTLALVHSEAPGLAIVDIELNSGEIVHGITHIKSGKDLGIGVFPNTLDAVQAVLWLAREAKKRRFSWDAPEDKLVANNKARDVALRASVEFFHLTYLGGKQTCEEG